MLTQENYVCDDIVIQSISLLTMGSLHHAHKAQRYFSGILDHMSSNQVSSLAAGLRNTNITIPIISTSSTAPSLSNKTDYPTFLRTIQPDTVAVKVSDACMGHLPDTQNCGVCMRRECWERFPRHRLQRKTVVSDPGMHHGTCVKHVPWRLSGSLTSGWRGKRSRHSRRMRNR